MTVSLLLDAMPLAIRPVSVEAINLGAQQSRVYADLDSSKSLDDQKFPGIKVTYTLEMGSMDHATSMHEETPKDPETALHDK